MVAAEAAGVTRRRRRLQSDEEVEDMTTRSLSQTPSPTSPTAETGRRREAPARAETEEVTARAAAGARRVGRTLTTPMRAMTAPAELRDGRGT